MPSLFQRILEKREWSLKVVYLRLYQAQEVLAILVKKADPGLVGSGMGPEILQMDELPVAASAAQWQNML